MKQQEFPEKYIYPAVFTYYGPGKEIAVDFPDLRAATSGIDEEDALFSARELLGSRLAILEEDGEEIPPPSQLSEIPLEKNERSLLVDVYMPSLRIANASRPLKQA